MSKKDVDEYYTKVCADYKQLRETLTELEEEFKNSVQDVDKIEQVRKMIEPLKVNYERISYIMYLFNKPVRRKKKFSYELENKKRLNNFSNSSLEDIHKENQEVIKNLKFKD